MGLFRGAVFCHSAVPENSPLSLMGRFPSLMGRFPTLMGSFPDFALMGRFPSRKSPGKQPIKKRGVKRFSREKKQGFEEILRGKCGHKNQKNPRAHKNKIGTPPPPPKPKIPPPPKTRNFMDTGFPAERTHFSRCP